MLCIGPIWLFSAAGFASPVRCDICVSTLWPTNCVDVKGPTTIFIISLNLKRNALQPPHFYHKPAVTVFSYRPSSFMHDWMWSPRQYKSLMFDPSRSHMHYSALFCKIYLKLANSIISFFSATFYVYIVTICMAVWLRPMPIDIQLMGASISMHRRPIR